MKLGLLVVLAVGVALAGLSEARTVDKCELKEKIGEELVLNPRLERFRERILSILICEVNRRSRGNTALVKVWGRRKTTTTAMPTVPETTTMEPEPEPETTTMEPEPEPETTTMEPEPETTTMEPEPETTTMEPEPETTTMKPEPVETTTDPEEEVITEETTAGSRRRRSFDSVESRSASSEESDEDGGVYTGESEEDDSMEGMLSEEEEDPTDDSGMNDSDEGQKRRKRGLGKAWAKKKKVYKPWSLAFYGVFGLNDAVFCDSGYRWSKNLCQTSCNSFTDDNIMDDIDCLVSTGFWRRFVRKSSWVCRRARNYLSDCE